MATPFTSPTGRLVWGDPFVAQQVMDDVTKQPKRDATGAIIMEFSFGVAYAKTDPLWPGFRKTLKDADRIAWPQFHDANGEILPGVKFADKITDGDGLNTKGQPRARGDNGYAGHNVVKYASRFAPSVNMWDGQKWVQMMDPKLLKCGDYIQVNGSTQSNNSQQSPGMYRNCSMVALYAQGAEIAKGGDPNEAFSAPPPGTSPPVANMVTAPPPQAGPATPPPAPPVAPPAAPPAPSTPIMLASANGMTYDAFRAAGWSDEQLIAAGHMARPVAVAPPAPIAPPAAPPDPPPTPAAPPPARVMLPAAEGQTYEALLAAGWTDALLIQHGKMAG